MKLRSTSRRAVRVKVRHELADCDLTIIAASHYRIVDCARSRITRTPSGASVLRKVLARSCYLFQTRLTGWSKSFRFASAQYHRVEIDSLIYSGNTLQQKKKNSTDAHSWPRKSGLRLTNTPLVLHREQKKKDRGTILFSLQSPRVP